MSFQLPLADKSLANLQLTSVRRWLRADHQHWLAFGQQLDDLAARQQAVRFGDPYDEVFHNTRELRRLVFEVDGAILPAYGEDEVRIEICRAAQHLFNVRYDNKRHLTHSLWYTSSRDNKISLHGIFPLVGFENAGSQIDAACYVRDRLPEELRSFVDLESLKTGQLRLPFAPKSDGSYPLQYLGEYDGNGTKVPPDFRYGKSAPFPPWRSGGKQPSFSDVFRYSTVANYTGTAPLKLGTKELECSDDFRRWKKQTQPAPNLDESPGWAYWKQEDERRARLDMRDTVNYWDPLQSPRQVWELVTRSPVEPFREAVEYMNLRFCFLKGANKCRLYFKAMEYDKDYNTWHTVLRWTETPEQWFDQQCGQQLFWIPSDPNPLIFPIKEKGPAGFNWFHWYLRHRLGVQVVTEVHFRPLKKDEPLQKGVLNLWRGLACQDFSVLGEQEVVNLKDGIGDNPLKTILKHVRHIYCQDDPHLEREFHHFVAYVLRKPAGPKIARCPVMNGPEGTGKTAFWVELIGKGLMGPHRHWMVSHKADDLIGDWTDHLEDKILCISEETEFGSGNRQGTAVLQQLISGDVSMLHKKFESNYQAWMFFSIVVLTNYETPLSPNIHQRRFVFFPTSTDPLEWTAEAYNAYFDRVLEAFRSDSGRQQYWSYLQTLDIDAWARQSRTRQSIYTMEQSIKGMRVRPEQSAIHWMFQKLKLGDMGIGRVVDRASGSPVTQLWGHPESRVEVSVRAAFEDYSRAARLKCTFEEFKDQIERNFLPEEIKQLVINGAHEGPGWRFDSLTGMQRKFEAVFPRAVGFSFEEYMTWVKQQWAYRRRVMAERGLLSEPHNNVRHNLGERKRKQLDQEPVVFERMDAGVEDLEDE